MSEAMKKLAAIRSEVEKHYAGVVIPNWVTLLISLIEEILNPTPPAPAP